jgi:amino acid transporter
MFMSNMADMSRNPAGDKYGFRFWKNPGPFAGFSGLKVVRGVFDTLIWACFA